MTQTDVKTEKISQRRQIQNLLVTEDRVSLAGSLGSFIYGIAWCLGAGFLLATVLWIVVGGLSWMAWFGIYLLVLIPLLFWQQSRQKDYTVASLQDESESIPAGVDSTLAGRLLNLFTWGPRQLLDGLGALRGKRSSAQNNRFKRAAQLVLELAKYSGGVEIKLIMHPPENMPIFITALDWLDKHGYVGRSSDGERLWISSTGRKKLVDNGIIVKVTMM